MGDNRANRLHAALANEYEGTDAENVETLAIDALTDLRHLCDLHGLDFGRCNRIAQNHYVEEL